MRWAPKRLPELGWAEMSWAKCRAAMDYAVMGWTKMGWAVTGSWAAKGYGLGRDMSSALGRIGIGWNEMGWDEVGYTRYRSSLKLSRPATHATL